MLNVPDKCCSNVLLQQAFFLIFKCFSDLSLFSFIVSCFSLYSFIFPYNLLTLKMVAKERQPKKQDYFNIIQLEREYPSNIKCTYFWAITLIRWYDKKPFWTFSHTNNTNIPSLLEISEKYMSHISFLDLYKKHNCLNHAA